MEFFINNLYTVVLIPFWVCLIILFGKLFAVLQSRRLMAGLTVISTLYSLIFSVAVFVKTAMQKGFVYEAVIPFLRIDRLSFDIGIYIDGLSAWLMLIVCIISLIVQIYSYSYMQYDKGFMRYFAYLNLFNFSMFGLVLSPNMFQTYIFWELVGASSYLLIGFWYKKNSASYASVKAFIMNRIGDFALLAGIILSSYIIYTNVANISVSLPFYEMPTLAAQIYACTSDEMFILLCILLLLGSVAKSAQFPLHTWLVDAMEGPTPVSALIHSATMVAAGVYLLARLYPLYSLNNTILILITVIGLITAVICSFSALTQTDIKKILAYSTNAQLGLMFFALGACSVTCAMIHLTSHAFIKAMLFLCAGVIIKSMNGNQDIRFMGGLRKVLPTSALCFFIGAVSLSGLLFAGFSSKELILGNLLQSGNYGSVVAFLVVSLMTSYYLFRTYFYIFEREKRYSGSIKEPDFIMNLSPCVLALIVIVLWFIFPKSEEMLFKVLSYFVATCGIVIAVLAYFTNCFKFKIPLIYNLSFNALYIDDFYKNIVNCYSKVAYLAELVDKYLFDSIAYLPKIFTRVSSWFYSKLQTGNVQSYIAYSLLIITLGFAGIIFVYNLIIYISEVS